MKWVNNFQISHINSQKWPKKLTKSSWGSHKCLKIRNITENSSPVWRKGGKLEIEFLWLRHLLSFFLPQFFNLLLCEQMRATCSKLPTRNSINEVSNLLGVAPQLFLSHKKSWKLLTNFDPFFNNWASDENWVSPTFKLDWIQWNEY